MLDSLTGHLVRTILVLPCLSVPGTRSHEWLAARSFFSSRATIVAASVTSLLVIALGAACFRQNMYWSNSINLYRRCVAVNPRSSASHTVLSRIYFDAGRPREAEAEAREALQLDPNNLAAYLNLSFYARTGGKLDKAIEYIEQAVSTVSENPMTRYDLGTAYLNLGLLYGQQKAPDKAEISLLKSINLSPRPVGWYYVGQFYGTDRNENRWYCLRNCRGRPHGFHPHLRWGWSGEAWEAGRSEAHTQVYRIAPPITDIRMFMRTDALRTGHPCVDLRARKLSVELPSGISHYEGPGQFQSERGEA